LPPVTADELTSFVSYSVPNSKSAVKLIDPMNMYELVELLHNEAKVI
jgi:electron transfer flavoprotein beta subunit